MLLDQRYLGSQVRRHVGSRKSTLPRSDDQDVVVVRWHVPLLLVLTLSDLPDRRLEPRHPDKLSDECFRRRKGRIEYHRGHPRWERDFSLFDTVYTQ